MYIMKWYACWFNDLNIHNNRHQFEDRLSVGCSTTPPKVDGRSLPWLDRCGQLDPWITAEGLNLAKVMVTKCKFTKPGILAAASPILAHNVTPCLPQSCPIREKVKVMGSKDQLGKRSLVKVHQVQIHKTFNISWAIGHLGTCIEVSNLATGQGIWGQRSPGGHSYNHYNDTRLEIHKGKEKWLFIEVNWLVHPDLLIFRVMIYLA
jgi:hypothetical protein